MNLTMYEARIVNVLQLTPKGAVRHSAILDAVYLDGDGDHASSNVIEVLVGRLRKKGYDIKSVRGFGYTLISSPSPPEGDIEVKEALK